MTTSLASRPFPTLEGRQVPHHLSEFPGDDTQGDRAVKLAGRVAKQALPWQVKTLFGILRTAANGLWTHADVVLICPRQNGKTLILVFRCLFGLFVLNERIIYSAQRWPAAKEAYSRLWQIIQARPTLKRRIVARQLSQGVGYLETDSGGRILFCTRSNDSGRSLDEVDLLIFDEAYNLTDGHVGALSPTQMASRNPQTIYASSAVNEEQHINGHELARMRRAGLAGEGGLYFAEYMAPPEMARDDPETWRYCTPSFGVIQNEVKMRGQLRRLSPKTFDVEFLGRGIWPTADVVTPPVISREKWGTGSRAVELRGPVALAMAMTPMTQTRPQVLSVALAQRTTDGRIHVELGHHSVTTPQDVDRIVRLIGAWDPCCLVVDRTDPAMALVPGLLMKQIEAEELSSVQIVQACAGLYLDAHAELLNHTGDPVLAESVEAGRKREVKGGGWAWEDGIEAVPLKAITAAHYGLVAFGSRVVPPALPPVAIKTAVTRIETRDLMAAGF